MRIVCREHEPRITNPPDESIKSTNCVERMPCVSGVKLIAGDYAGGCRLFECGRWPILGVWQSDDGIATAWGSPAWELHSVGVSTGAGVAPSCTVCAPS